MEHFYSDVFTSAEDACDGEDSHDPDAIVRIMYIMEN